MKKELSLIALSLFAALPAAASQQSDSQGFIDDSHLDLFLRNAYISRDYHQGQQDKAEWGQGIIATFASGYTEGLVGFGVDGIAQYGVRLDGGRGKSGAGGIDFFKQEDDGRAKSDLAKFGATAKMRISNTVLSYGNQRPELPIVNADSSRLLFESYTGTMLTSKEIDGLEVNAGYFTDEQRKSDDRHDSGLKSLSFGGASYQFNDQFSGALYASHNEEVMNKQYLGMNFKQPFSTGSSWYSTSTAITPVWTRVTRTASTRAAATPSGAWRRATSGTFTRSKWRTSRAAAAPATTTAAIATRAAWVTAVTPSGWRTPTGLILTAKMNVPGRHPTVWTLPALAYRA